MRRNHLFKLLIEVQWRLGAGIQLDPHLGKHNVAAEKWVEVEVQFLLVTWQHSKSILQQIKKLNHVRIYKFQKQYLTP